MEDIFEVMEDKKNTIVEPFKGVFILILKICKKNKLVEIPSEIQLDEVKRDGKIFEELKNMKKSMKEFRKIGR